MVLLISWCLCVFVFATSVGGFAILAFFAVQVGDFRICEHLCDLWAILSGLGALGVLVVNIRNRTRTRARTGEHCASFTVGY